MSATDCRFQRPPVKFKCFCFKKTATPEVKKAATLPCLNLKSPPAVQRPLPPTPEAKKSFLHSSQRSNPSHRRNWKAKLPLMPWYHNVDRRRGEELLRNAEDGCFLIRPSTQTQNPLTLTLYYNKRMYNISVRHRPDDKFALGTEKVNEQSFCSVEELVTNYQTEQLVLFSGGERTGRTLLTASPPQPLTRS